MSNREKLDSLVNAAIAALSQNAHFPADIELAQKLLADAMPLAQYELHRNAYESYIDDCERANLSLIHI